MQRSQEEQSAEHNSLLDGDYDEKEAAQAFQQALSEWRKENTDPKPPSTPQATNKSLTYRRPTQLGSQRPKGVVVSPVHTPSKRRILLPPAGRGGLLVYCKR